VIEWKQVNKNELPKEGSYLFIFDGKIFEGWTFEKLDDEGFPYWQANEGPECYEVRWYAEINWPDQKE
jgi:hypothetical protein